MPAEDLALRIRGGRRDRERIGCRSSEPAFILWTAPLGLTCDARVSSSHPLAHRPRKRQIIPDPFLGVEQPVGIAYPRLGLMRRDIVSLVGVGCFLALLLSAIARSCSRMASSPSATQHTSITRSTSGCSRSGTPGAGRSGTRGRTAGSPLLGNPMAAVLYPGKVLYAAAALSLGRPALRDRAYDHRLPRHAGPGAVAAA